MLTWRVTAYTTMGSEKFKLHDLEWHEVIGFLTPLAGEETIEQITDRSVVTIKIEREK